MIKAVLVINTSGKIRLCQFYEKNKLPINQQQQLARQLHCTISARSDDLCYFVDDFVEWPTPDTRVVYRRYATLCFIFITDSSESCLAILDLIQVFVEVLDKVFKNVCELDFYFHSEKVHRTLMEIVMGGMVLEMSKDTIVRHIIEMDRVAGSSSFQYREAESPFAGATAMPRAMTSSSGTSTVNRGSRTGSERAGFSFEPSRSDGDGGLPPPSGGGGGYHDVGPISVRSSSSGVPEWRTADDTRQGGRGPSSPPSGGTTSSLLGNPFNVAMQLLWGSGK